MQVLIDVGFDFWPEVIANLLLIDELSVMFNEKSQQSSRLGWQTPRLVDPFRPNRGDLAGRRIEHDIPHPKTIGCVRRRRITGVSTHAT